MKVSEFSVKHPVVITMILIALVAFGFYSLSGMRTEFIIGKGIDAGIGRKDLVQHRFHLLHVAVGLGSEHFLQYIC